MAYTQVGSLVSFTAGTTIVSADVNQNFADIRTVVNALVTGTDTVQAARINPVSGAGVSVNAAALDYSLMRVGGSFTSGGASTVARSVLVGTTLTAANGDTGSHAQLGVAGSITTQGNSETVGVVATVHVSEPDITVGSGDTVTNAAAVYIEGAPTEGTNNYALFVDSGVSRLDGGLIVGTGVAQGYRQARVVGAFTSDGSSSFANAMSVETALTGANGDTDRLTLLEVGTGGSSITTQGNSETVADVAAAFFDEPDITVGAGDTVTNASTVKINSAPTEGTNNYALWVDAGDTRLDGGLLMTGTVGVDVNPGSDADADLITVGVTGAPTLSWDESEDAFLWSKPITLPAGADLYRPSGPIYSSIDSQSNTTTGSVETVETFTIPANTLAKNGDQLRITGFGRWGANAEVKQALIQLDDGTDTVSESVASSTGTATYWALELVIERLSASTCKIRTLGHTALADFAEAYSASTALDFTTTIDVDMVLFAATTTGHVTSRGMTVEFIPAIP